jgi:hypothetical protein
MPKVQLRLPKAKITSQEISTPEPIKTRQAKTLQGKKSSTAQVKVVAATMDTLPTESHSGKSGKKAQSKPVAALIIENTPGPEPTATETRPKRETRLRGKIDVARFLPRVERKASLRTRRSIQFLEQIEARAIATKRLNTDGNKFPMSILEAKALNEAIRLMQQKLVLEEEYLASVKGHTNGASKD